MACPALSSRQGGSATVNVKGEARSCFRRQSLSALSLHAWACCHNKCNSEVKRFIFSIHQVPKTYSYFIMHLSEEEAICSDTWTVRKPGHPGHLGREVAVPTAGLPMDGRGQRGSPSGHLESHLSTSTHMGVTPPKVNWQSWVPAVQRAEMWSQMYGFLRKKKVGATRGEWERHSSTSSVCFLLKDLFQRLQLLKIQVHFTLGLKPHLQS